MNAIRQFFVGLWEDERAEITIEYGLLTALVALGLIGAFIVFKDEVGAFLGRITARIQNCPQGSC